MASILPAPSRPATGMISPAALHSANISAGPNIGGRSLWKSKNLGGLADLRKVTWGTANVQAHPGAAGRFHPFREGRGGGDRAVQRLRRGADAFARRGKARPARGSQGLHAGGASDQARS